MHISGDREQAVIAGNAEFPVNKGGLCVKGWSAAGTLAHRDRLTTPLVRDGGTLRPASWDEALERIADRIGDVQGSYGRDAVGVFGSGALTNEKAYLLGKFARVALGTANIDYNGRFCMSSGAAASVRAFGLDRGLPFPLDDIAQRGRRAARRRQSRRDDAAADAVLRRVSAPAAASSSSPTRAPRRPRSGRRCT